MKNDFLPTIGITMGDASGVGPEVIMKSIGHGEVFDSCHPLVIGDAGRLREAGSIVGANLTINAIQHRSQAEFRPGIVDCVDLGLIPEGLPWGVLSAIAGDAAYRYIVRAVDLAKNGEIDAICTAPLNKEALHAAGHIYPGHTELLAELTSTPEVSMMLSSPKLRVIHVTAHIGLIDAIHKIEPGSSSVQSCARTQRCGAPDSTTRASAFAESIRTPENMAFLATEKKNQRSNRQFAPAKRKDGLWKGRYRRTHCFSAPAAETSTSLSRCTMIRAMAP